MIDTLLRQIPVARKRNILASLGLKKQGFVLITLHRPANVDEKDKFLDFMYVLKRMQEKVSVVFPAHPRTQKKIKEAQQRNEFRNLKNLMIIEPLGYYDFLSLMMNALMVVTDSGGIQEETTVLGVPCLTTRPNTERPITITHGSNILVGTDPRKILTAAFKIMDGKGKIRKRKPPLWDGRTAQRIVKIIRKFKQRSTS